MPPGMANIKEQASSEKLSLSCDEDGEARQQAESDTAQSHQDDAEEDAQQPQEQPAEPAPAPAQQHHQLVTVGSGSCTVQLYPADTGFPACTKADDFMSQSFFEHPAAQQYLQAAVQLTWGAANHPFDQVRATGKSLLRYAEDNFCVEGSEIHLLLTQAREDYSSGAASLLRSRGRIGQPPPKFCMLHGTISHITSTDHCNAMRSLRLSFAADATPENSPQLRKALWRQSICNPYCFAKQAQARQSQRDRDRQEQQQQQQSAAGDAAAAAVPTPAVVHPTTPGKRGGALLSDVPSKRLQPAEAAAPSAASAVTPLGCAQQQLRLHSDSRRASVSACASCRRPPLHPPHAAAQQPGVPGAPQGCG
uniref:Uncharacterized protein n=1 Tax=Tetradesmus obliquus TaxID=3088 RepID=A0A383WM09_TETOB|eukprot:jgi/Sobl393_1/10548/SZX77776.1